MLEVGRRSQKKKKERKKLKKKKKDMTVYLVVREKGERCANMKGEVMGYETGAEGDVTKIFPERPREGRKEVEDEDQGECQGAWDRQT
ncbi:hypothetical protein Pmani_021608 [Petrolisthes manimaculis]|uniref:Uncharacterized protein n=1 Tax=Petrolisthes manimaculis TaxID=1843537 RepID=A0AAE1U1H4_9EUCA|nr:hypothetical protein Pmani_021608 [Petrolisthes manimaculis]